MKKSRKILPALMLSALILITGCAEIPSNTSPQNTNQQNTNNGQQAAPAPSTAPQSEAGDEVSGIDPSAQTPTPTDDVSKIDPSAQILPATIDIGGTSFAVSDAVYFFKDDGCMVVAVGEHNDLYALLTFATMTGIEANTSLSQSDFGNTMELAVILVDSETGDAVSGSSLANLTNAAFSVTDIADSCMNVSMSGKFSFSDAVYDFKMLGSVTLTDSDTCGQIITRITNLVAGSQGSSSGNNLCPACNGTGNCCICHGSTTCQSCYGRGGVSYNTWGQGGSGWVTCSGCNGTGRCKYCNGGICDSCGGTGRLN